MKVIRIHDVKSKAAFLLYYDEMLRITEIILSLIVRLRQRGISIDIDPNEDVIIKTIEENLLDRADQLFVMLNKLSEKPRYP